MLLAYIGMHDEVAVGDLSTDPFSPYITKRGVDVDLNAALARASQETRDSVAYGLLCQEENWEPRDDEAQAVRQAYHLDMWQAAKDRGEDPGPKPTRETKRGKTQPADEPVAEAVR